MSEIRKLEVGDYVQTDGYWAGQYVGRVKFVDGDIVTVEDRYGSRWIGRQSNFLRILPAYTCAMCGKPLLRAVDSFWVCDNEKCASRRIGGGE